MSYPEASGKNQRHYLGLHLECAQWGRTFNTLAVAAIGSQKQNCGAIFTPNHGHTPGPNKCMINGGLILRWFPLSPINSGIHRHYMATVKWGFIMLPPEGRFGKPSSSDCFHIWMLVRTTHFLSSVLDFRRFGKTMLVANKSLNFFAKIQCGIEFLQKAKGVTKRKGESSQNDSSIHGK